MKTPVEIDSSDLIISHKAMLAFERAARDWLTLPSFKRANPTLAHDLKIGLHDLTKAKIEQNERVRAMLSTVVFPSLATPSQLPADSVPALEGNPNA